MTLGIGVFCVVFALVSGSDRGWGSPTTLGSFAFGALFLAGHARRARTRRR